MRSPFLKNLLRLVYHAPPLKGLLKRIPLVRNIYPHERTHPIDALYGVDTSGVVPVEYIHRDRSLTARIIPYIGSDPGVVRGALAALGNIEDYTLVDLGCGKGRAVIVGSEFPFRAIIGVELSTKLASTAKKNAAIVAHGYPSRPAITIHEANVTDFQLPDGKLVMFLYHAFGRELLAQLLTKLASALRSQGTHLFFVYDNPVCGDVLDSSPAFTRWYADMVRRNSKEGLSGHDAVVIWQSIVGARPTPHRRTDRRIIITDPKWRADLED
jgi:SAM-dependent methyltransferase